MRQKLPRPTIFIESASTDWIFLKFQTEPENSLAPWEVGIGKSDLRPWAGRFGPSSLTLRSVSAPRASFAFCIWYAYPCCDESLRVAPVPARIAPEAAHARAITGVPVRHSAVAHGRVAAPPQWRHRENSLAAGVVRIGQAVSPMTNLLREHLLDADLTYGDETTVPVLKEPGRNSQTKSYMWGQPRYGSASTVVRQCAGSWCRADTVGCANAGANLCSLIERAKASGIELYRNLVALLKKLPLAPTADDYEALLP